MKIRVLPNESRHYAIGTKFCFFKFPSYPINKEKRIPYNLLLLADETVEAIDKYIHDSEIYVLEQEKKLIAIYVLQTISPTEMEIKNIAVDNNFQGLGIGRFLLQDAFSKAEEKGFKAILIGTANAAIRQLSLYQRAGFEIDHIKKDFYIHNYPEPIYENGILLNHMIMLKKAL